jgi:hypothetical protein
MNEENSKWSLNPLSGKFVANLSYRLGKVRSSLVRKPQRNLECGRLPLLRVTFRLLGRYASLSAQGVGKQQLSASSHCAFVYNDASLSS